MPGETGNELPMQLPARPLQVVDGAYDPMPKESRHETAYSCSDHHADEGRRLRETELVNDDRYRDSGGNGSDDRQPVKDLDRRRKRWPLLGDASFTHGSKHIDGEHVCCQTGGDL